MTIQLDNIELTAALGRFHRVVAIQADQKYLSICNTFGTEFLIPVYPGLKPIKVSSTFIPPPFSITDSVVMHLDHLEIHDVTHIIIAPELLKIRTGKGVTFQWKVHPHVVPTHA